MDIYGVIGWPIKHSLSPAMHNAAFKELGIDAEYRKFEVRPEGLEDFLLNRKDVKGFNITIPHKVRAKEILEKKFPMNKKDFENWYYVHITGALNTVKRNGDRLTYINTDVRGFLKSLVSDLKFNLGEGKKKDKNVLLIGCGGAGRAVIAGLSWDFVDNDIRNIYIYDKDRKAINLLRQHFLELDKTWEDNLKNITKIISESEISKVIKDCQLLVNASPVGMKKGDAPLIDKKLLHRDLFVYDAVYNRTTQLVEDIRLKYQGHAVNGRGMLRYQGAYAFEFWTEVSAGRVLKTMKEALDGALNKE